MRFIVVLITAVCVLIGPLQLSRRKHPVEIPEMDITSINKTTTESIKPNKDLDFFCGGSEKSRFQWLHKKLF